MAASVAATSRSAIVTLLLRPFQKYNQLLDTNPYVTKSLTSGAMYAAGDLLCQAGEHYNENKGRDADAKTGFRINWKRLGIFAFFGTFVGGPAYSFWFNYLDLLPLAMLQLRQNRQRIKLLKAYALLKRNGIKVEIDLDKIPAPARYHKWIEKGAKIAADQLVFSSIYTLVFFMTVGTLTGATEKIEAEIRAQHIDEVQGLLSKHSKAKLENELTRLKSRLSQRGTGDVQDEAIDRVLALLNEEKKKSATLTWSEIVHHAWSHTQEVYVSTYIADCIVWPPLQLINFTYVPVRFQVLYVNLCNLGWNTFLSFMANKKH